MWPGLMSNAGLIESSTFDIPGERCSRAGALLLHIAQSKFQSKIRACHSPTGSPTFCSAEQTPPLRQPSLRDVGDTSLPSEASWWQRSLHLVCLLRTQGLARSIGSVSICKIQADCNTRCGQWTGIIENNKFRWAPDRRWICSGPWEMHKSLGSGERVKGTLEWSFGQKGTEDGSFCPRPF